MYNELMATNGGCALPCWWGYELGVDSVDEVRQPYEALGAHISEQITRNGLTIIYTQFVDPEIEDGLQVNHSFVVQDGIVIEVTIHAWYDPSYQIEPLLQSLGQPDEAWMWTIPDTFEGVLPANFLLYFPERGVLVGYAVFAQRTDDVVHVCFDGRGAAALRLWSPAIWDPAGSKGLVQRANESGSAFSVENYRPIEEVSN